MENRLKGALNRNCECRHTEENHHWQLGFCLIGECSCMEYKLWEISIPS